MQPTSRAVALAAPVRTALTELNAALNASDFEPRRSTATFRLIATDYFSTLVLPALVRRLEHEAPEIDLRIVPNSVGSVLAMLTNNDVEFAAGIFKNRLNVSNSSECEASTLFTDKYVCVMRRDHPFAREQLTKGRYLKAKHIHFSPTGSVEAGIERYFRPIGVQRRIGLIVSHYLAAPLVLEKSDMIMTVPQRMAKFYKRQYSVHMARLPIQIPPLPIQLAWNVRFSQHPAYKWLKSLIEEISSGLK
jgi:DNA-binding transcriptional LysR family regulator